jgi:hypothetical protein
VTADALRQDWARMLDALNGSNRVTSLLLADSGVVSFDEGILTLQFPRQGSVKGFTSSKHEGVLKEFLHARYGVNVMIRAIVGGMPATGDRRPGGGPMVGAQDWPRQAAPAPPAQPAPAVPPPAGPPPPSGPPEWAVSPSAASTAAASPGPAPGDNGSRAPSAPAPGQGGPYSGEGENSADGRDTLGMDPDDDPYGHDEELAGSVNAETEITGLRLIERDLGASVIAEYED